ncbi:MAG: hypothetical protein K2X01_10465 [Cyanobacteria bacterium]|nr:hypothetical protein [Cyanobacteriota bacterium]
MEQCLDTIWLALGNGNIPLAVRSSAVDEDGSENSYAGQMETCLNITTRETLSSALLTCWRSLHSDRANTYRTSKGALDPEKLAMAVVFQHMLKPEAAGVLFTVNPVSGRPDELLISSVWGLGEGLVSGELDADTFITDRTGTVLSRSIVHKTKQISAKVTGLTELSDVPMELQEKASLCDPQIKTLVQQALLAEKITGHPLDIEFAVSASGEEIYFLQARPVTGFVLRKKPEDGNRQVWDNANINESYPGITLPLTFSFIRNAYYCVYWQFCEVLGITEKVIQRHESMLNNMLGLIQGRVYYNLLNWYQLVSMMPGFQFNKGFMEAMMGLETPDELNKTSLGIKQKYVEELPSLIRVGFQMIWLQWTLWKRVDLFHQHFNKIYGTLNPIDFEYLAPHENLKHFETLEQEVLWSWKAPIINDFSAMIYYGILKKLTANWKIDPDGSLQNALISGQGEIESTQVMEQLLAIARQIETEPDFKAQFIQSDLQSALKLLETHPSLGDAFCQYLAKYGDRCMEELKLESFSMRDNPDFCISMIQNYLKTLTSDEHRSDENNARLREEAEETLRRKMKAPLNPCYWIYRWILFRARSAIRNRENQRLARTRAFALVRRIFRAIGTWFSRAGLLNHPRDIFYLEVEEIRSFIQGTACTQDLKTLVDNRKKDYSLYEALPPLPDHFVTFGPVAAGVISPEDVSQSQSLLNEESISSSTLTGLGACPGKLTRKAVVLLKPDTSVALNGEILVTRQTDPGWVVLFPSISGLVVERGSMLSHSAIVAREMGIPAVVGVKGATTRIHSGDLLALDGQKGTVEILEK